MSDDNGKKPGQPEESAPAKAATKRHSRSRRDVLKHLVVGGAAIAGATQILPKKWMKPVVDSVVLPVHAQATGGTITAFWILGDDAPGGPDVGIPVGTTTADTADAPLYDDGTTMRVYGTLAPPAAVVVNLDATVGAGTTYTGGFGATDAVADPGTGDFFFGDSPDYSPANGDFGDTPGDGTITLTFSAPGYANSVITLIIN